MVGDLLAAANVVLALTLAYLSYRARHGYNKYWRWMRLLFIGNSIYWAAIYIFVLIAAPGEINPILFGQIFIRPAFTFTLALMVVHTLLRAD